MAEGWNSVRHASLCLAPNRQQQLLLLRGHGVPLLCPLARTAAVRGNPKENTDKSRCGWPVLSALGPRSASTYRHCEVSGDQHGDGSAESSRFLDSTPRTARDRLNSRALTVAFPTQLQRSPLKKQHPAVWAALPLTPPRHDGWAKQTHGGSGEGRGAHHQLCQHMGMGGSPSSSLGRDPFISKEVLRPQFPLGDEGTSSSCGENEGPGIVSYPSAGLPTSSGEL